MFGHGKQTICVEERMWKYMRNESPASIYM